ncbi:electron transfer flavoprotein subunit beta/FixA family protein [Thermodesulfobacteriota bacterium]
MKIMVCIKQIRHIYARTGMDPARHFLAPEDEIVRVNPYDEAAVEWALRIKAFLGAGDISLLTLGPIIADAELRRCLSMGADRLFHVDKADKMDPWCKASALAQAAKKIKADIVLCGKESLDNQNGQVGAFMAHHLKMPFVSAITRITVAGDLQSAKLHRIAGRGKREIVSCPLPAVFSVEIGSVQPRLPTYQNKQWARSQPIRLLNVENDTSRPRVIVEGDFPPRPRPKKVRTPDSGLNARDRIQQLLEGSRREANGLRLTGSPESQVEGIISFLSENGFIKT